MTLTQIPRPTENKRATANWPIEFTVSVLLSPQVGTCGEPKKQTESPTRESQPQTGSNRSVPVRYTEQPVRLVFFGARSRMHNRAQFRTIELRRAPPDLPWPPSPPAPSSSPPSPPPPSLQRRRTHPGRELRGLPRRQRHHGHARSGHLRRHSKRRPQRTRHRARQERRKPPVSAHHRQSDARHAAERQEAGRRRNRNHPQVDRCRRPAARCRRGGRRTRAPVDSGYQAARAGEAAHRRAGLPSRWQTAGARAHSKKSGWWNRKQAK